MTQQPRIPEAAIARRKQRHERAREVCCQLDLFNLQLDEIIAGLEAHIRDQKRQRLTRTSSNQPIAPDTKDS